MSVSVGSDTRAMDFSNATESRIPVHPVGVQYCSDYHDVNVKHENQTKIGR